MLGELHARAGEHLRRGVDRIDLSAYDANSSTPATLDAFVFVGTSAFTGVAGALDDYYDSTRGVTVLQGDTNGDKVADFAIDLTGNISITASDSAARSFFVDVPPENSDA